MDKINFLILIIILLSLTVVCLFFILLYYSLKLKRTEKALKFKEEKLYLDKRVYTNILDAICGEYSLTKYALVSLEYIYHVGEQPQVKFTKSK